MNCLFTSVVEQGKEEKVKIKINKYRPNNNTNNTNKYIMQ